MKSQNFPPLSEKARKLFSKLVDVNWEMKQYQENNRNSPDFFKGLIKINEEYTRVQTELINEMVEDHFNHYMDMVRRMFA